MTTEWLIAVVWPIVLVLAFCAEALLRTRRGNRDRADGIVESGIFQRDEGSKRAEMAGFLRDNSASAERFGLWMQALQRLDVAEEYKVGWASELAFDHAFVGIPLSPSRFWDELPRAFQHLYERGLMGNEVNLRLVRAAYQALSQQASTRRRDEAAG